MSFTLQPKNTSAYYSLGVDFLLQETAFFLLLETGFKIILDEPGGVVAGKQLSTYSNQPKN